jgi:hypothetical protein
MNHEKTFNAISKLKDIEMELHRLKNALEMANRALDAERTWVGLTEEEEMQMDINCCSMGELLDAIYAKLKQKNGYAKENNTRGQE